MTAPDNHLTNCDREPIHTPGSIQPHGLMLVVETGTLTVRHGAGDIEGRLGVENWAGGSLASVIGDALTQSARALLADQGTGLLGRLTAAGERFDVSLQMAGPWALIELEPAPAVEHPASAVLRGLETAAAAFDRTIGLKALCEQAAVAYRMLTGFDRVMVYRFLDDDSGTVVAEAKREDLHSFMNHHFPGSDVPRQARALYVLNLFRVIPDVAYVPAVLRPAWPESETLDMSDAVLRSVSPIHLQYLHNMGVAASASVSIVKDGILWGLIACHHETPREIGYDTRIACRALAGGMASRIKAREEAHGYRERIRLRGFEDEIVELLSREGILHDGDFTHPSALRRIMGSDGLAVLRGDTLVTEGVHPPEADIRELGRWVAEMRDGPVFSTDRLSTIHPPASAYQASASGLMSLVLSAGEPWIVLWFRAEEVQVVEWAGNPHKGRSLRPGEVLSPRASFEAWREAVHGRSRRWSLMEIEAAGRLRPAVLNVLQGRQIRELNVQLTETLTVKDLLLQQKEFLIGEINHRVQNSLALVSSFLALQAREVGDPTFQATVEEARRRLNAVALVHRRLYRGDQIEMVDAAQYLSELCADTTASMGKAWEESLVVDLASVKLRTDRAVILGLILTELMINANKYAYDGTPGPLEVRLLQDRKWMRLTVSDQGRGRTGTRTGFGSKMIEALVKQLRGELNYEDNRPGLRASVAVPLE